MERNSIQIYRFRSNWFASSGVVFFCISLKYRLFSFLWIRVLHAASRKFDAVELVGLENFFSLTTLRRITNYSRNEKMASQLSHKKFRFTTLRFSDERKRKKTPEFRIYSQHALCCSINNAIPSYKFVFFLESAFWGGTWGKHTKSVGFKTLFDYQKMNHFPGTFQIGRKDRLWRSLQKLMAKHGKHKFVLPIM